MYEQLCDYVKQNEGASPLFGLSLQSTSTTKTTTASNAMTTMTNMTSAISTGTPTTNNITTFNDDNDNDAKKKKHQSLSTWTKKQFALWNRMKKDGEHNLSLERISKLCLLNFEQMYVPAVTPPLAAAATASTKNGMVSPLSVTAGAVGGGSGGIDSENAPMLQAVDQCLLMSEPSIKRAKKWQEKFDSLKQYKELHGELSVSSHLCCFVYCCRVTIFHAPAVSFKPTTIFIEK